MGCATSALDIVGVICAESVLNEKKPSTIKKQKVEKKKFG